MPPKLSAAKNDQEAAHELEFNDFAQYFEFEYGPNAVKPFTKWKLGASSLSQLSNLMPSAGML